MRTDTTSLATCVLPFFANPNRLREGRKQKNRLLTHSSLLLRPDIPQNLCPVGWWGRGGRKEGRIERLPLSLSSTYTCTLSQYPSCILYFCKGDGKSYAEGRLCLHEIHKMTQVLIIHSEKRGPFRNIFLPLLNRHRELKKRLLEPF